MEPLAQTKNERLQPARDLLACLRWDKSGADRLSTLTAEEWNALWRLIEAGAGQHFLSRRLQHTGIQPPQEIAAKLRARTMAIAARNLAARAVLAGTVRETGRSALLLKGVDLADRLYGNLGHRPMGDVDFLVHEEDVALYDQRLRARGYAPTPKLDRALLASGNHRHLQYRAEKPWSPRLELHWRLAERKDDQKVDMAQI